MQLKDAIHPETPAATQPGEGPRRPPRFVSYLWVIVKNVIGWVLVLCSGAVGLVSPGPFGVPLFFIGFALITFPGKRKLTARVLKGKPVPPHSRFFRRGVAIAALAAPAVALFYLEWKYRIPAHRGVAGSARIFAGYTIGALVLWFAGLPSVHLINMGLRQVPRLRRRIRPWMRRKGIDLLPPRRRKRFVRAEGRLTREPDPEILAITEERRRHVRGVWASAKPWVRRIAGLLITAAIFVWIARPIVRDWDHFRARVWQIHWERMLLASVMFALFLFVFRALSWRRILIGFGHRVPIAPATRVWSTSELARYLPGVIWQVVGRAYLIKPYGVSGSICSTSQILELILFLLANVLVAITCLLWNGFKHLQHVPASSGALGTARLWLIVAMALVPVLLLLLHPRVFYGTANRILRRVGKPPVKERLGFGTLAGLLLWVTLGLLFQSLAIWVLAEAPLGLQFTKWWVVAGAYCLAWCAGFLAFWAPGGIGVRELVFITAMEFMLPKPVRESFNDPAARVGFLAFLSVLLRLWATAGELMVAGLAYAIDYRGAMGRADAPGRVARKTSTPAPPDRMGNAA